MIYCIHDCVPALLQSVRGKLFDDHSAVYHLLEDKLQRQLLKSHNSGITSSCPTQLVNHTESFPNSFPSSIPHELTQPIVTQRRSSITTGVGK